LIDPLRASRVAVFRDKTVAGYPEEPPFGPAEPYPEYPFPWPVGSSSDGSIYRLVRETLRWLGLDAARFGNPDWNPLGEFIRPGDTVLVKPNWVFHAAQKGTASDTLFVKASVIRPVLDYIAIALQGKGRIILADAPLQSADFDLICKQAGIPAVERFWSAYGRPVLVVRDLRRSVVQASRGDRIIARRQQQGDPGGYRPVNLGLRSHLTPLDNGFHLYRVTNYNALEMCRHHNPGCHEYLIPNSVLETDVVINLAKLKTHRKGGISCALKNLVGINGNKDWLPHHRAGSIEEGGDEYAHRNFFKRLAATLGDRAAALQPGAGFDLLWCLRRLCGALARLGARDPYTEGSWYGNDTLWRTVLDLNTLLLYANREGLLCASLSRRHLAIVDAVVAGEGEGPLECNPRREGMFLAGANPLAVDAVAATLIGHDPRKIPVIARGFELAGEGSALPLALFSSSDVRIVSNEQLWNGRNLEHPEMIEARLNFVPAAGWKSHVELPGCGGELNGGKG